MPLLAGLACTALIAGCGGTGDASPNGAPRSKSGTKDINRGYLPQPLGDKFTPRNAAISKRNRAACERAVQGPPGLSPSAKKELAELCFRINYIPEDNEATVRSACEEAANASSLSSVAARKHAVSVCYSQGFVDRAGGSG